jgi:hypothetical protein
MIAVMDYGLGNIGSIVNMIKNYWLKCLWEAYCGFCIGIVTVFGGLYIIASLINA